MENNFLSPAINVYLGEVLKDIPVVFILEKHLRPESQVKQNLWNLFQVGEQAQKFDFIKIVKDPQEADFFMLPHNYFILRNKLGEKRRDTYLEEFVTKAKTYNKKILVLAMADSDEDINIENSIIFRQSQYGYKKKANEIIMPFFTSPVCSEVFMAEREKIWQNIVLRDKSEKPVVSFCGWAGFPSFYRHITYLFSVFVCDFKKYFLLNRHAWLHKRGIYFRRKAMSALGGSKLVETNFIIRKSYSAQKGFDGLLSIAPEEAEKQYVENILNSDFVLSPKGNGNGSIRFYEALSLGRFPVLINTDCVLPLADVINYNDFVVEVEHDDLSSLECKITEFYNALDNEEFHRRQRLAREAFEMLRPDVFFKSSLSENLQIKSN